MDLSDVQITRELMELAFATKDEDGDVEITEERFPILYRMIKNGRL